MKKVLNFDKVCRYIAKNSFYTVDRVKELIIQSGSEYFEMDIQYLGFGQWEVTL